MSFRLRHDKVEPNKFPGEFQIVGTNEPITLRETQEDVRIIKWDVKAWTVLAHVNNTERGDVYLADIPSGKSAKYRIYGISILRTAFMSTDRNEIARACRVRMWEVGEGSDSPCYP